MRIDAAHDARSRFDRRDFCGIDRKQGPASLRTAEASQFCSTGQASSREPSVHELPQRNSADNAASSEPRSTTESF